MAGLTDIDSAWGDFCDGIEEPVCVSKDISDVCSTTPPKCSEIYISTKTKIAYLNQAVDLSKAFWKLPILPYHHASQGIIKKQMKFNSTSQEELNKIIVNIPKDSYHTQYIITHIINPGGRIPFKDVRKISIGLCKKDIISHRGKQKGAFYNCFVVLMRIKYDNIYREIHIKVFNTGKLEIPGIQNDELLYIVLDLLVDTLNKHIPQKNKFSYEKQKCSTVLINSNFTCGYYLNREKLYTILKTKYRINCSYDSCSYPGIQCEFYYDTRNKIHNGQQINDHLHKKQIKNNSQLNKFMGKVSFMIFRTGSALIVGKCTEEILQNIYHFICNILREEYSAINCGRNSPLPSNGVVPKKKNHKKKIIVSI